VVVVVVVVVVVAVAAAVVTAASAVVAVPGSSCWAARPHPRVNPGKYNTAYDQ